MDLAFADCVLRTSARQLFRGGAEVLLEPKMYLLLEVLIERRPAVVTYAELDELLWPRVYVARTSLTRLVSELRSVLGDAPNDSRIIRTAYKTGYAFAAAVTAAQPRRHDPVAPALVWNDRIVPLGDGEHVAGRGVECSVVVDDSTVSRRHARLTVSAGRATIEDLQSTNGTFVNDVRTSAPTVLADGDRIRLGDAIVRFRKLDPSARTEVVQDHGASGDSTRGDSSG